MEKQRRRLVNSIQGFCLTSLTLLALIFLALQITDNRHSLKQRTKEMRIDYITQQKELIKREMERVLSTIDYQRSRIGQQAREVVRQRVYEAHAIAENIYKQNSDKSNAAVQKMIVNALRPLLFNQGTGYYFIFRRSDAINILQADRPEMEGKIHRELQDASGRYILREAIANTDKEFFYDYLWSKPGAEGNDHQKVAFIKTFEPYDWIIGTGLYLDDVEALTQNALLEQISAIRYGKNDNGYFFVGDWQGINLVHGAQPDLVGQNMWEATDSKGTKTTQQMIALAQQEQGGYVEFWWRKPDTGEERPKIVYARGVRDWQWLIGTGLYTDDIEGEIVELEKQLNQELYLKLRNTTLLTALILLLFLVTFRIINRRLLKDFSQFSSFFEQAANTDTVINQTLVRFAELYQMAGSVNRMVREKIAAQHRLQDEKDRYKALHEASFGGILLLEQETVLDFNNSLCEITGYSAAELNGMNTSRLIPPDSLKLVLHDIEIDYQRTYEIEGLRRDGSTYPMVIRGKNISYKGRNVKVLEIRDITERKQAEAALQESESKLRNILLNLPIALGIYDDNQKITFLNKRFVHMFGYTVEDLSTFNQWWQKVYPNSEKRQQAIAAWAGSVQKASIEDSDFSGFEFQVLCKDGKTRIVSLSGIPLEKLMLVAFIDISDRKRVEEERQNVEKLKTIGTLAGGLAHDFNNILAGLYGNISLAKNTLSREHPALGFIESAENSMETATQLTNQLLTFTKGGAPIKTSLSLADLIKETVNFNLSGSNVKPQISEPDDLWLANVDQGQMQQVFGNLTINAKQAMPDGGHLSILIENAELAEGSALGLKAGKYIRITVTDEGSGIEADYLDRIFEPYFTTKHTGSGLGLATSYSIINRHDGHISVTTELGKGTTFTLYLPATTAQKPSPEKTEITAARQLLPGRILIMDDEETIRKMLTRMLKSLSYNVESCADGQQALDLYRQAATDGESFELVILDLTIPGGMGGKETAQRILDFDPQARIVISSGYAEDQLMADHDKYGLVGFVAKPYNLSTLEKTLARAFVG